VGILTNRKATTEGFGPHDDLVVDFPYLAPPHTAVAVRSAL
jgi:hypothetical protein